MKLNSKVTGGLAWAGLFLVLAVPSADMLTKPSANSVSVKSSADPTQTASIAPAVKPVVPAIKPAVPALKPVAVAQKPAGDDVVGDYVSSGKKLPSYISDAPVAANQALQPVATEPLAKPATTADGTLAEEKVMNLALVAPVPYPAAVRPKPTATTALPADDEAPLVLDEDDVARREATLRAVEPVLSDEPQIIEEEELQQWDSGSLADYLERRGLISEARRAEPVDPDYDSDGFYLSDGPNKSKARLIRRLDDDEVDFFLF